MSELTYKYEVLRRFINLDETHHDKSSEGDKGGSRATTITNRSLPRAGTKFSKDDGNHTSGCYGSNPLEPMPPVIIFKSLAKDPENMKIRPSWSKGLPVVTGEWGLGETTVMDTQVSVRPNGSMEEDLYIRTCLLYLKLYPNIAPRFEWDGDKLVRGPIMIKSDSGQGRQCKSERSIKFREDMHRLGMHMMPGLPNSTSATQEMDDVYTTFKGMTDARAQKVFTRKIHARALAVDKHKKDPSVEIPVSHITNDDIAAIVNGKPDDPIEERPFDFCFQNEKIWKSFTKIGWTPFTRAALKHKKVRHMLGEGGASEDMKGKLERVQERYDDIKEKVKKHGINSFVFNSKIPVHKKHPIMQKTEDEQVEELVEGKKAFSASGQWEWATIGVALIGSRAICRAQRIQMQREVAGGKKDKLKKLKERMEKVNKAQEALTMFRSRVKFGRSDWDDVMKFLVRRFDAKDAPSKYNNMTKIKAKLDQLEEKYNKAWDVLLDEELTKARADIASEEAEISEGNDNLPPSDEPQEHGKEAGDGEPEVMGDEEAV